MGTEESWFFQACRGFLANPKVVVNPYIGVCYSFNYNPPGGGEGAGEDDSLNVTLAGELYGLELKLDLGSMVYMMNGLSPRLGAKMQLHKSDHLPIISAQGPS